METFGNPKTFGGECEREDQAVRHYDKILNKAYLP